MFYILRFISMQLRRTFLNVVSGVFSCVFSIEAKTLNLFPFNLAYVCISRFSFRVGAYLRLYVKSAHFLIYIKTLSLCYPCVVVESAHEVLIGLYSIYYYTSVLEDVCFLLRSLI